jgi:hypothetical protein
LFELSFAALLHGPKQMAVCVEGCKNWIWDKPGVAYNNDIIGFGDKKEDHMIELVFGSHHMYKSIDVTGFLKQIDVTDIELVHIV